MASLPSRLRKIVPLKRRHRAQDCIETIELVHGSEVNLREQDGGSLSDARSKSGRKRHGCPCGCLPPVLVPVIHCTCIYTCTCSASSNPPPCLTFPSSALYWLSAASISLCLSSHRLIHLPTLSLSAFSQRHIVTDTRFSSSLLRRPLFETASSPKQSRLALVHELGYISTTMHKSILALSTGLIAGANAFWRMECPGRVGLARMDPIINPGEVSGHVHAIHGSSGESR